jgi:hypothetical protein
VAVAALILAQDDLAVLAVAVVVTAQVALAILLQLLRRKVTMAAHLHKVRTTLPQAVAVHQPQAAQVAQESVEMVAMERHLALQVRL